MQEALPAANDAVVANATPHDAGGTVAGPRVDPAPQLITIAGWEGCPSGVVLGALRLAAVALQVDLCCLCWQAEGQRDTDGLDGGGHSSDEPDRRRWLGIAQSLAADAHATTPDGVLIVPVRGPTREIEGALAVRQVADRQGSSTDVAAVAAEAARHISQLLASSEAHTARSTAYEALVEIGTQIQALEVQADAIFALIVERARDLLQTDVAWLAMVDQSGERLRMKVAAGTTTPDFMRMQVMVGTGIGGVALKQRRPVAVRDSSVYRSGMPRSVHRALDDEGVTSILCAPMLRDEGMVGALYVGTRLARDFGDEEAALLSALALQAAVTIENARLYSELTDKNDALEWAFAVHRRLTDASLAGVGLDSLALRLAQLVERDIVLRLTDGSSRCARYPRHPAATAALPMAADELDHGLFGESIAIMAGGTELGMLTPLGDGSLSALQLKALEHGATVIALELVKEKAALETEWRLQGELLEELLRSGDSPGPDLLARAERFGVDLSSPHRLAALQPLDGTTEAALLEFVRRSLRMRGGVESVVAQRGEFVIAAFAETRRTAARDSIEELQQRAQKAGLGFACGLSGARTDLRVALREARGALALAARARRHGVVVTYEDLGPLRFMIDAPDTSEMSSMVRSVLGALAEHDDRRGSELLLTLRAYIDSGGHHPKTAERCHIHVSTLKYRLSQISKILDRQLTDPRDRFELGLAYEVLDVLEVIGGAPFSSRVRSRPG